MDSKPNMSSDENKRLMQTALKYADDILQGVISPYEGGRRIWFDCQLNLEQGDHRLDPFVYWASEYEETSSMERQELCNKALRESASLLLKCGSAL